MKTTSYIVKFFRTEINTRYFLIAFIITVWLILTLVNFKTMLYTAYFVTLFANGYNYNIRVFLFLGYAALCFLTLSITSNIYFTKKRRFEKTLMFVLIILVTMSIFSHLYFVHSNQLRFKLKESYWIIKDDIIETTSFYHMHTMKPVGYYLLSFLNLKDKFGRLDPDTLKKSSVFVDAGYSFTKIIPPLFYKIATLFYISIFFLFLLTVIYKEETWKKYKYSLLTLTIISSFSIMKTLLDGGFLGTEFIFSLLIFLFILKYDGNKQIYHYRKKIIMGATIAIAYLLFLHYYINSMRYYKSICLLILYAAPIVIFSLIKKKKFHFLIFSIAISLLILIIFKWGGNFPVRDRLLLNTKLYKGQKVWITTYYQILPFKVLKKEGPITIYEDIIKSDSTIYEYATKYSLDCKTGFNPISIHGTDNCGSFENYVENCFYEPFSHKQIKINNSNLELKKVCPSLESKTGHLELRDTYWRVILTKSREPGFDYDCQFFLHKYVAPVKLALLATLIKKILGTEDFIANYASN